MLAESLIRNNANVNERNPDGWTPVQEAAFKGHENIVDLLIRNGAQVNNRDNMNRTPLYMAAEMGL